jgi:hypothetical protein
LLILRLVRVRPVVVGSLEVVVISSSSSSASPMLGIQLVLGFLTCAWKPWLILGMSHVDDGAVRAAVLDVVLM